MSDSDASLETILNFRRLSHRLITSGLPTEEELRAVAQAGFGAVISLLPDDDAETLPGERAIVEGLGLAYEQIPVIWERPTHEDLHRFRRLMERYEGRRLYVHCAANLRVSSFIALDRVLRLGWSVEDAMEDVHAIWQPYDYWQAFIDAELAAGRDTLRVHIGDDLAGDELAYLQSRLDPHVALTHPSSFVVHPSSARCHVLLDGEPSAEALAANPELRAVIVPWTGIPPQTRDLLRQHPHIAVYNSHHPAQATAETAFALLLAAAKHLIPLDRALRVNDWSPRQGPLPTVLLAGKTALLLGYGEIGKRLARMCRGFDMQVIAVRRDASLPSEGADEIHPLAMLPALLPHADFLLISLPLTPETAGLVGERELAMLPGHAVLVNVGRGPVVDEAALYHALQEGRLLAAGLDVWYNYPEEGASAAQTAPSRFPFGNLDNVVLSPHRGGVMNEARGRQIRMEAIAELLNAMARGEPVPNRVNLEKGY